jgi:hypothetical protein
MTLNNLLLFPISNLFATYCLRGEPILGWHHFDFREPIEFWKIIGDTYVNIFIIVFYYEYIY